MIAAVCVAGPARADDEVDALLAARKVDEALAAARRGVEKPPLRAPAIRQLVRAAVIANQPAIARDWLTARLGGQGGPAPIAYGLGMLAHLTGDLPEGEARLRSAVKLDPGLGLAWNALGAVLLAAGRVDEALAAFDRSIAVEPSLHFACLNAFGVLAERGRFDDLDRRVRATREPAPRACWAAALAAKQQPVEDRLYALRGEAKWESMERLAAQLLAWAKITGVAHTESLALYYQSLAAAPQGRSDEALALAERALPGFLAARDTMHAAFVHQSMGDVRRDRSELSKALQEYAQARTLYAAIRHDVALADVLRSVGDIHLRRGELDAALGAYDEALPKLTGIPLGEGNVRKGRGDVLFRRGDLAGARREYDAAKDLFAKAGSTISRGDAVFALGNIAYQQQRYVQSLGSYLEAMTLFAEARYPLGIAESMRGQAESMRLMGELDKAIKAYEDALKLHVRLATALGEGTTRLGLAGAHEAAGRLPIALEQYERAAALIDRAHGDDAPAAWRGSDPSCIH